MTDFSDRSASTPAAGPRRPPARRARVAFERRAHSEGEPPMPREVADALWLWGYLDRWRDVSERGADAGALGAGRTAPQPPPRPEPEPLEHAAVVGLDRYADRADADRADAGPAEPGSELNPPTMDPVGPERTEEAAVAPQAGLARHPPPASGLSPDLPLIAATVRDKERVIHRALRPLRQTVPSAQTVLDEEATAEQIVYSLGWLVQRPALERCWEIVLVVDESRSMSLWLDTVPDLVLVLERQGVFRDVHVRFLDTDVGSYAELCVRGSRASPLKYSPVELLEPTGRRVVWVFSDAIGQAWRSGAMSKLLWTWARRHPVAVVNPLSHHMWHRTGLRHHRLRLAPATAPGTVQRWEFRDAWSQMMSGLEPADIERVVPVPALEPDARWIAPWARQVSGRASCWTEMTAVLAAPQPPGSPETRGAAAEPAEPSARELVQEFRASSSACAFGLATHLAAAPLTWPVIRRILGMVPDAGPEHMSELFLGGLLCTVGAVGDGGDEDAAGTEAAERVVLDFIPGVRHELLAFGRRSDTKRVLRAVGDVLGPRAGALHDVERVLADPDTVPVPPATEENQTLLAIEEAVMAALSGRYVTRSKLLRNMSQNITPSAAGGREEEPSSTASVRRVTTSGDLGVSTPPAMRRPHSERTGQDVGEPAHKPEGGDMAAGVVTPGAMTPTAERRREGRSPAVWGNVPQRNPYFTGRGELLRELHERLHEGTTAVLPEALHGMGGVGKSQLAVEYVHRRQSNYDVIWWIPAERTAQIGSALVELAQRLGLRVGVEANTAIPAVREALRTGEPYSNWLLVFDNAEDPRVVREFFPQGGKGRILVTSRNPQWASVARPLEVDVFTREESKELLRRRGPELSEADANRLAEALGDLPLAIEQAATWRAETGMSATEYLRLFEEKRKEILGTAPPVDYELPVQAAWNVSLDRLAESNPAALRLLQVCAFFAPEPISRLVFRRGRGTMIVPELDAALRDPFKLNEAIREVNRYALARIDHRTNSLQMHRLVQAVLIERMSPDERETMQHGAHALLAASDPDEPEKAENWSMYAELYPHVLAAGAIEGRDPWIRELLVNEVKYLYRWGDHEGSCQLAERTYEGWHAALGEDDPHTLTIARWYGWMLYVVGRYREAAEVNARLLELFTRVHGNDHPETLAALGNVAADKVVEGNFTASLAMREERYQRALRIFGPDDSATLIAAHNLGVTLRLLGEFSRARDVDQDTWERRVQLFGEDDERSLGTLSSVLIDRRELGDYVGARNRQEEVLQRLRRVLKDADDHPAILRATLFLAIARRKAGDHDGALASSREAQRRFVSRYGEDHPETMAASLALSVDLRHNGDLVVARDLCERTKERYRSAFGDDHPHTLAAAMNLATTYRLAGDAETARDIDRDCVTGLTRRLDENHPSTLVAAVNLASDMYAVGEFQAAYDLDLETLGLLKRVLGDDHPSALACAANLAMDLRALGNVDEAERLHAATLVQFDHALGVDHPATRGAASWVRSDCDIDPMPM